MNSFIQLWGSYVPGVALGVEDMACGPNGTDNLVGRENRRKLSTITRRNYGPLDRGIFEVKMF